MTTVAEVASNLVKGQNILSLLTFLRLTSYLWPPPAVVNDCACYDFIIIGGGTAGCVIASRLVELNASVLLIEAGGEPPLESLFPGMFPYLIRSKMDWNFTSQCDGDANRYHKGGVLEMQQGKLLGGSSQVNYMIHTKGIPESYNKWAQIVKDPSWEYKYLCRFFKKTEKVVNKKILNSPDIRFHGTEGKMIVKKTYSAINEELFRSYKELGHKIVPDINPNNTLGFTNGYFNIYSGIRQSTAYAYIRHVKNHPKLSVLYSTLATKVIFNENKQAVGVEIQTENNKIVIVTALKEVIITAGVFKSPQLLMLSGVGPTAHLKSKNIKLVVDLPVGKNFHDHPVSILLYKMKAIKLLNAISPFSFPVTTMLGNVALKKGQRYPDYHVLSGVISYPEFFIQACTVIFNFNNKLCDAIFKAIKGRQVHFVTHSLSYPNSRGEVILNSIDPKEKPIIKHHYYSNDTDLYNHAKFVIHYNKILNTTYFKKVGAEIVHLNIISCNEFGKGTVDYWKCYLKATSTTLHMYSGTCGMGSVVDSKFQVIGVTKLRVADASVIPFSIGAPTHATTAMLAEKLVESLQVAYKLPIK